MPKTPRMARTPSCRSDLDEDEDEDDGPERIGEDESEAAPAAID